MSDAIQYRSKIVHMHNIFPGLAYYSKSVTVFARTTVIKLDNIKEPDPVVKDLISPTNPLHVVKKRIALLCVKKKITSILFL